MRQDVARLDAGGARAGSFTGAPSWVGASTLIAAWVVVAAWFSVLAGVNGYAVHWDRLDTWFGQPAAAVSPPAPAALPRAIAAQRAVVVVDEMVGLVPPLPQPAPKPAPALPAEHVVIPKIGVASTIADVTLGRGEWPVPKFIVGHLAETANPGDVGNAVFAGHLLSLASGNVFARLEELAVGDEMAFLAPDNDRVFRVIETKLVRNTDVSVLASRPGVATVTLITCAGKWIPWENDYDHRRVVVAELVTA